MTTSIQERLFPMLTCFGCGPANPQGLQLRSYDAEDGTVIATFTPWPEHDNGFGFLNGGIISTVLDCHSAAVVIHNATDRGWLPGGETGEHPYVTADFELRFRRPTPLEASLSLWAKVESLSEEEAVAIAELRYDGKVCAAMRALWKKMRRR
jgi:acyl-coenzyme A thioesterase PaaI-like protein